MDLSISTDTYGPKSLFAGSFPVQTEAGSLTTGNLTQGRLLERGVTLGTWVDCDTPASAEGVLASDADASGGAQAIVVYVSGSFDEDGGTLNWNLACGPADGPINDATRAALKANNIYLG